MSARGYDCFSMACIAYGLPCPQREFRFHPDRKFRFDYAWPERKVAVEMNGGIWMKGGGAHSRPTNIKRDMEKNTLAAVLGWRILSYEPRRILDAIPEIAEALK